MWAGKLCGRLASILIFTPFLIFAQSPKNANNWYFGQEAGLDFQNGAPVALSNGAMSSFEGTAVANDDAGQLLFYTNGGPGSPYNYAGGVWNKAHQLMPNGNLNNAGGCNSSLQSSLVLKHPQNPNTHYLFTTDCIENNGQGGLRFSLVDMRLDGGLGDIAVSGVALTDSVDESLTAVRHSNGEDYWVICHKSKTDTFHVYHLTYKGISGVTTIAAGPKTEGFAGSLKASPDGKKLVYAGQAFTYLFNFNNSNGEISNGQNMNLKGGYTAEFSSNSKMLYVANSFGGELYQYNLIFPNPAVSKKLVGTSSASGLGSMQLAPDGKIYMARLISSSYLAIIEEPNKEGLNCNFQDMGLHLGGKKANAGLPNFPNDIFRDNSNIAPELNNIILSEIFTGVRISNIGSNTIDLNWDAPIDREFTLAYRPIGSTEWTYRNVQGNSLTLEQLLPETTYQIRLNQNNFTPDSDFYTELNSFQLEDLVENNLETDISWKETLGTTLKEFEIALYPNPSSQSTKLHIRESSNTEKYQIELYSIDGKKILHTEKRILGRSGHIELNLEEFASGIYQIIVKSKDISKSQKLVLMR